MSQREIASIMNGRSFNHVLMAVILIFLIGCAQKTDEQHRKGMVQSLIKHLASKSLEEREVAYAELRDVYVRKRDIHYLNIQISQNPNSEVANLLRKLITYMEERWRLPYKGWTDDRHDLLSPYFEKAKSFESTIFVLGNMGLRPETIVMEVYFPDEAEHSREIIDLILTLESETLWLISGWKDITFLSSLTNLQELKIEDSKVDNLMPLKGLPELEVVQLKNTKVTDLTPLKKVPNLQLLYLERADGIDITPLKGTSIKVIVTRD